MNEIKFANKIRQALNEGARLEGPAGAAVAERLRAARERALALKKTGRAPAFGWARVSSSGELVGGFDAFSGLGSFLLRVLLPTLLLVAGLFGIYSWQQDQRAADIEELDAQLLTDDLPIDAYLDRGFEAWLKKVSAN
jgi:hypothetical protein